MDSTDSITLPKGIIPLNEDSTANADIRYDTSIDPKFVGKEGGLQRVSRGIYSNDLQTRVRIDSNNNAIFLDVNGVNVMEMNSIGETYAPELNYKVLILTVALYKQIILTVILYCFLKAEQVEHKLKQYNF